MDKIKCCIVRDLMPLYIDEVLSEESAQEVRNHLAECESCRGEYGKLSKDLVLPSGREVQEENGRLLKQFKSRWTRKKILIAVISSLLTVLLFFPVLDRVVESELFSPSTTGLAGAVGQLQLGRTSHGEWTRLTLTKKKLFSDMVSYGVPYLKFDNPFYQKTVINSGNSATAVELRILDVQENIVLDGFVIEPGEAVPLDGLEYGVSYIVEYRAEGDYYVITFA